MEKRIVFHVDFDYFYAQCEEIRDSKIKENVLQFVYFPIGEEIVELWLLQIIMQEILE